MVNVLARLVTLLVAITLLAASRPFAKASDAAAEQMFGIHCYGALYRAVFVIAGLLALATFVLSALCAGMQR